MRLRKLIRTLTLFEYTAIGLLIYALATWHAPLARLRDGEASKTMILLLVAAMVGCFALGARSLFTRDRMFDEFQWFLFFGGAVVPIVAVGGLFAGATESHSVKLAAVAWIVIAVTGLLFALPSFEGHKSLRYRRRRHRLRWIAPIVGACLIAAALTALWPAPPWDPAQSPYRAWFPRESL